MAKSSRFWIFLTFGLLILAAIIFLVFDFSRSPTVHFDATRAMQDAATQLAFGPRLPGSEAHRQTVEYVQSELELAGWQVEIQEAEVLGHPIQNINCPPGTGYTLVHSRVTL